MHMRAIRPTKVDAVSQYLGQRANGRKKRLLSPAAAMLTAAVAMSGCGAGTSSSSRHTESVHTSVATGTPAFTIGVSAGGLHLVPGPIGRVSLEGTVTYRGRRAPSLSWQDNGKMLSLRSVCHSQDGDCGYNYTLSVPVPMRIVAGVSAGDILARGLAGSLRLSTTAGDVTLSALSGALEVTSGAGDVTAADLRASSTDIDEGTGDVALNFTATPSHLLIKDSTGDVDVVVPDSSHYHVSMSDHLGKVSDGVTDDPSSPRVISVSVGIGDVSLEYMESG
jgi:Putative adhesin